MELGVTLLERVRTYESLSRLERSELGRELRRLGLSYGEIMELIPVKKSTLATWCRDVVLTDEQVAALQERGPSTKRGIPRDTQRKRHREVDFIQAQATLEAEHLLADSFWTAGVSLYWGEGSKTIRRLAMANADAAALRMFKRWSECYLPPNHGWRARINLHADNDEPAAREWWSAEVEIPPTDFTKTYVKPDGTGHRKNHLPYGVCTLIKRKSADAFVITMAWVEFLQGRLGR
jgi:hypothetical protein